MSESTTTSNATSAPAEPAAVEPELSPAEQIENLLSGKPKQPEKAQDAADPGGDPNTADAAAKPEQQPEGADATDDESGIDYAQEVPLSSGEKLSVGELKDFYQDFAARQLDLVERENSLMTRRTELEEVAGYLQLPPEVQQRIQQQQGQYLREQHGQMLEAIPEWKDQKVFEQARGQIFELGKEYGVDLSRVADHRVVKMLNDYAKLRASIRTAKANVKQMKTSDPKAPKVQQNGRNTDYDNAKARALHSGNIEDQVAAVDMLLRR